LIFGLDLSYIIKIDSTDNVFKKLREKLCYLDYLFLIIGFLSSISVLIDSFLTRDNSWVVSYYLMGLFWIISIAFMNYYNFKEESLTKI